MHQARVGRIARQAIGLNGCLRQPMSRSLNIFTAFSKEAVAAERERIFDEINHGYFDDFRDLRKHGGKVIPTPAKLEPQSKAVAFPKLTVYSSDQTVSILPRPEAESAESAGATLICMSFRDNCQEMADSWARPLREAFPHNNNVHLYEVSWVESGFLSLFPVRKVFLKLIHASKASVKDDRKIVYSFGNSYDVRKALHITNRLAGYMYLVDKQGRVRWTSSGVASSDEASCLISCTSAMLEE